MKNTFQNKCKTMELYLQPEICIGTLTLPVLLTEYLAGWVSTWIHIAPHGSLFWGYARIHTCRVESVMCSVYS